MADKEKMTCPHCGKVYTKKNFYDKHVIACLEKKEFKNKVVEGINNKVAELQANAKNESEMEGVEAAVEEFVEDVKQKVITAKLEPQKIDILSVLCEIRDAVKIDKNVKIRLENILDHTLALYDKVIPILEKIAKTPAVIIEKGEKLSSVDEVIEKHKQELSLREAADLEAYESLQTLTYEEIQGAETLKDQALKSNPKKGIGIDFKKLNEKNSSQGIISKSDGISTSGVPNFITAEEFVIPTEIDLPAPTPKSNAPIVGEKVTDIQTEIKGITAKALLLIFSEDKECWIPKSCIKNDYDEGKGITQSLTIDNWVLKKNEVI